MAHLGEKLVFYHHSICTCFFQNKVPWGIPEAEGPHLSILFALNNCAVKSCKDCGTLIAHKAFTEWNLQKTNAKEIKMWNSGRIMRQ